EGRELLGDSTKPGALRAARGVGSSVALRTPPPPMPLPEKLQRFADEAAALDKLTRSLLLLDYAEALGPYPEEKRDEAHRVRGCTSLVYLDAAYDAAAHAMRY